MKIKTKRDRDNQTAYERRRIALSYLSEKEFADRGLRFIDPYKKDLDLKLPISSKEKFNTLEG